MNRVPRRHRAAPSRTIDGAAIVIQTRLGEVSQLNAVGSHVWAQIDGTRTESELARAVAARFQVTADVAARDVAAFLDELAAAGLVEFAS